MPRFGPFIVGACTDRGMVREENEDNYGLPLTSPLLLQERGYLFAVADGVGGYGNGQQASALTIETLYTRYYGEETVSLPQAIQSANMAVRREALQVKGYDQRMGATLVALLLQDQVLQIAHVGDSRAYLVRQQMIQPLTLDHSFVQEQVQAGLMNAEQARVHQRKNVITRAMGNDSVVTPDMLHITDLQPGDIFILCSDGLNNHVTDLEIATLATQTPPEKAVAQLTQLANQNGGSDNITVMVLKYAPIGKRVGFLGQTEVRPDHQWARVMLWVLMSLGIGGVVAGVLFFVLT
ncbi:PP2C family protein-serine/threonine phosphatase [Candidatus Chloroploca asiatica]|uniref:PPM-type phosphatase domain-containing protein n=1 Tax=Candidatus Chloroploca asiatica TaxID=1506545 RepID=A0A2H3L0C6_9CHLR|nr:protein phosphatase 2C domain-containing protein [Candidatus Chloroploca asiatica]PDV98100.1 hypothetical protein A9Q02_03195 [Candidatus Chloroploca asiatica]